MEPLENHFGPRIRVLHWCSKQNMSNALVRMDLTASQGRILGYLNHAEQPLCPRDIEETFHMSHPTVSGLLARLEKKGFLELRPDPADRRCKRIYLLPRAQECFDMMDASIRQHEQQMVRDFSEEEKALFRQLLDRAIQNMGEQPCKPKEESQEL